MKSLIYILLLIVAIGIYNQVNSYPITIRAKIQAADNSNCRTEIINVKQDTGRVTFKTIEQVVQSKKNKTWVEFKDSAASLALHFSLSQKDTLAVSYSSECWLFYPYKIENQKIILYWDKLIDSKYRDFDILKAIKKTSKKYKGQPFMTLELANDTTLRATYLIPDLVKKINNSSKERIFFPAKFSLSQKFYL